MMQIETCDGILAGMEEMLGRFQGDLGNISTEIRSLQEQSQSMSVKLKNRKAAEQKLGAFLDNLAVPAGLIEGIVQRDVDDDYQVEARVYKQVFFPFTSTAHSSGRPESTPVLGSQQSFPIVGVQAGVCRQNMLPRTNS